MTGDVRAINTIPCCVSFDPADTNSGFGFVYPSSEAELPRICCMIYLSCTLIKDGIKCSETLQMLYWNHDT